MPTDPKPLFRLEALRPKLAAFALPPAAAGARPKLGNWTSLLHSKAAEKMKETELLTFSAMSSAMCWATSAPRPARPSTPPSTNRASSPCPTP